MTRQVVYSMCCRLPEDDGTGFRHQLEMVELWLAHLRGPGRFTGRVVLITNERRLPWSDVEPMPLGTVAQDRTRLFLQRVLIYDRLPVRAGETWMQLDVDALAVRPIEALFAGAADVGLRAAPSGFSPLHPMHARWLVRRHTRLWYGRVRGWDHRLGVSACLTSCTAERWHQSMGAWAALIRRHGERPMPILGDQSFLNLLYMTGKAGIRLVEDGAVLHVRDERDMESGPAEEARVLHFPNPRKLAMMKQMSVA